MAINLRVAAGFIVGVALGAMSAVYPATLRTVDFEDSVGREIGHYNLAYQGLRFSPRCTARFVGPPVYDLLPSTYISLDDANNCGDGDLNNQNYLGPRVYYDGPFGLESWGFNSLYVDRGGAPFSLLGIQSRGQEELAPTILITTSKSARVIGRGLIDIASLAIPQDDWTDILWFTLDDLSDPFHNKHGYDDIRYSYDDEPFGPLADGPPTTVDEPPDPATIGMIGLLVAWLTRRDRRPKYDRERSDAA